MRDDNLLAFVLVAGLGLILLSGVPMIRTRLTTSPQGRQDIIRHEGIRYEPYKDAAGYWTVGIGHLIVPGDGVSRDATGTPLPIDETLLMTLFETDLKHAEDAVNGNVKVQLSSNQFDALVDFVFNLGAARFKSSTLLQKLNSGDYPGAADEFKRWVYAGGKKILGLAARRDDNYTTFLT